jgi:hypothetical protein
MDAIFNGISSGKAFVTSAVFGIPTLTAAVFTNDFLPVATGAAIGVLAFLFAIRNYTNDKHLEAVNNRLDRSEKTSDEYFEELNAVKGECGRLKLKIDEVTGNYDLLKKRLATHVCPVPADPSMKCSLPDIINITL